MFEYFKERRLAAVFFATLMFFLGGLALGGLVYELTANNVPPQDWVIILTGMGLFLVLIAWYWIRQWQRRVRLGRYESTPLSDDERMKARRKLAVKQTVSKR